VNFGDKLAEAVGRRGTAACVGIDPQLDKIPGLDLRAGLEERAERVRRFSLEVVEAVAGIVAVIKPQSAFFEQLGAPGLAALAEVVGAARQAGLIVLLDGKRGDIGSTAEAYAAAQLDEGGPIGADAVTVSPYLGPESLAPYERRLQQGKGIFVLVRTSNPGAAPWQLETGVAERVADWVASRCPGPGWGPVGAVVGATLPAEEVARWRAAMPRSWLLVPGFGAQGAGPDDIRAHFGPDGLGALVSSSREVLYAPGAQPDRDVRQAIRARATTFAAAVRPDAYRAR
jgi:orotidine-5'-phosphate decarboxylase